MGTSNGYAASFVHGKIVNFDFEICVLYEIKMHWPVIMKILI